MNGKLVALFLLLLPSLSHSDEYVLLMSKEDNVCQHMLKIYNQDLKDFGDRKINFAEHVILQFTPENQLKDICYFLKACSDKKEGR